MTSEVANNFTSNNTNAESITIDGETWRNQLQVSYSLTDKWELSIAIPHVAHDGGSFDGFIEDWHKVFGLPNKARRAVAQNKLNYQLALVLLILLQNLLSKIDSITRNQCLTQVLLLEMLYLLP